MNMVLTWMKEQWQNKKFRIYFFAAFLICIALCIEFAAFQYGICKVIRYLILLWGLFAIAWIDGHSKRIPNHILTGLLVLRTMLLVIECIVYSTYSMTMVISVLSGMVFGGGLFLLCHLITRNGIGAGDVKLFAVLGYYLGGSAIFTTIFLTVLTAAIYSIFKLLMKKTSLKQEIPFAPFVLLGTVLTMALGM